MTNDEKGERGIRSILYALYQSPCPIPINCETQVFEEADGSKTSLTLKDGKVTLEHQKSRKSNSSNIQQSSSLNDNKKEEEDEKVESQNINSEVDSNEENQENKINAENDNEDESNYKINDENNNDEEEELKHPDNSFEYVTSAHGKSHQYDFLFFVNDGKIDGDCPKDLSSQLRKIYKHIYKSILDLYDLPITKLSLHFGVNDKGEIEEEEKNENGYQNINDENVKNENKDKEPPETNDSNQSKNENGKLEDQVEDTVNGLLNPPKQEKDEKGKLEDKVEDTVNGLLNSQKNENVENEEQNSENKDQDQQETNDNNQSKNENGRLEDQMENNVNGLLGSPKQVEKEDPPHSYEIFLLEDSSCTTSTQTVGTEGDDDDIDGKFGEFFSEEMKIKINYDRCYFDLQDCGVSNYKAPRSMCILLKAHKKFPKASCARLHDLIQTRFERFDEEENKYGGTDRNSYSTDLNASSNYTVDSTSFNNREYINFTKTIIDYDLYNENKRPKSALSTNQKKKKKNDQKNTDKNSEDSEKNEEPKTTELNDPKVFVCVRCWHLISSINYVSFMQHKEMPIFHTLPPLPFQPVVPSELYDKRLYPMGLTTDSNKPYSFILSYENSPYRRKVPQPRKPPAPPPPSSLYDPIKRPSTSSSLSSTTRKKQDVFARLLSNTWTTQKNDNNADRQFEVSKGYKRPKTKPVKMLVFQENSNAVKSVKRSYANPPFNINIMSPKRKKKLHPAFGGPEDFSFRMGGPNEVSGRKSGDNRPDFVI